VTSSWFILQLSQWCTVQ